MTDFSICINRLQWSFIFSFLYFLSSPFSLPAPKTPSMVFRHSEKLKTCDWEEKCLKYMNRNKRSDSWTNMRIEKPVKFIIPSLDQVYSFQEWIIETKNEINIP